MKFLIALVLILNLIYIVSANEDGTTKYFVNFVGSFEDKKCKSKDINGTGFSFAIGQCITLTGMLHNDVPFYDSTNWKATLQNNNKRLVLNRYDDDDRYCKQAPIKTYKYTSSNVCTLTPPILSANNSLLYDDDIIQFSKITFPTLKPEYAPNSIIYGQYDTPGTSTTCNYANQDYGIAYTSESIVYDSPKVYIKLACNQVQQPMMFKCDKEKDKCYTYFIDKTCQFTGDVQTYCTPNKKEDEDQSF